MTSDFEPLFRNPHLATIAGNFWPRSIDETRFPQARKLYRVDDKNAVVSIEHQPGSLPARGQIVFLHGLEGSASAGYIQSFAQHSLERGFGVHRLNMRTCGGTEDLCETFYHSGLTGDPLHVLEQIVGRFGAPIYLIGFSLGGNVALKLAGELGQTSLLAGVCAVSTPIDLAVCVRALDRPSNCLYARRFLTRLKDRVRRKAATSPGFYSTGALEDVRSIWDFDDRFTASLFGFGTAANYYATQSAARFLHLIRIPTLVICSKDDPIVPFQVYDHPAFQTNPALSLVATKHGGHLGFLSKRKPRFWIDGVALTWIEHLAGDSSGRGTKVEHLTSA